MNKEDKKQLDSTTFGLLLKQAIFDYQECTEDDERTSVIQHLIDDLKNPELIK